MQRLCRVTLPAAFATAFASDADEKVNAEAIKKAGGSAASNDDGPPCGLLSVSQKGPGSSRVAAVAGLLEAIAKGGLGPFEGIEGRWVELIAAAGAGDGAAVRRLAAAMASVTVASASSASAGTAAPTDELVSPNDCVANLPTSCLQLLAELLPVSQQESTG